MPFIDISLLAVACCMSSSLAFAQSPDIERQVDSLEHKTDATLDLLQKQNGSGNAVDYDQKSIAFVMVEPGDRAPKAIPSDRLFIKQ